MLNLALCVDREFDIHTLFVAFAFRLLELCNDDIGRCLLDVSGLDYQIEILGVDSYNAILRDLQRTDPITRCIGEHGIIWKIVKRGSIDLRSLTYNEIQVLFNCCFSQANDDRNFLVIVFLILEIGCKLRENRFMISIIEKPILGMLCSPGGLILVFRWPGVAVCYPIQISEHFLPQSSYCLHQQLSWIH